MEGGAVGESTEFRSYAYRDEEHLRDAMRKYVANAPCRLKNKKDRIDSHGFKKPEDVPADKQHLVFAVEQKKKCREKKRGLRRGKSGKSTRNTRKKVSRMQT